MHVLAVLFVGALCALLALCVLAFLVIGLLRILVGVGEGVVELGAWARDRDDRASFIMIAASALAIVLAVAVSRFAS